MAPPTVATPAPTANKPYGTLPNTWCRECPADKVVRRKHLWPGRRTKLIALDSLVQGVCALIQERLSTTGQEAIKQRSKQGTPYPLKESSLGFDTGDPVLNQAAKVLRLLYVQDLRDLQTRINEAIVAVQTITANPKTDTRLGKVGR
ncbi:RNA transcription, translation and transport factor protein-like [Dermacentor silvarum]|uniref:RNA transcription, translation and transport factor protein-like n=1 Tax=Dermacentor silvarum TaxID=543639 RepID=UPI0021017E02|nr:RNA transcription, translation and transport factor protein-like [Dermacentor silvarum]